MPHFPRDDLDVLYVKTALKVLGSISLIVAAAVIFKVICAP